MIVHGSTLSLDTIDDVIRGVERELHDFESSMAAAFEANVTSLEHGIGFNRAVGVRLSLFSVVAVAAAAAAAADDDDGGDDGDGDDVGDGVSDDEVLVDCF